MQEDIAREINSYDYPLSARFIAKQINDEKKTVNAVLHNMKNANEVVKLEPMDPPLWRLTPLGIRRHIEVINNAGLDLPANNGAPMEPPPEVPDNIEDNQAGNALET